MPQLGAPELIIILVIIILIFGVGKLPEVGQALGKGIREFRGAAEGQEDDAKDDAKAAPPAVAAPPATTPPVAAPPAVEAPRQPVAAEVVRPATTAAAPVTAPAAAPVEYVIVSGDTLDTIATKHGITVEELMAANGYGSRERTLYAGDKIRVPAKTTA